MVSLCTAIWQVFLCQAIGIGLGIGLLFLPSISILSQYFFKRRALAIGIAVTGSSIGGIVLPIMLNNLIESHGFKKAVQYTGYLLLGCLILANALMHPRLPPNPNAPPKPSVKVIFSDKAYSFLVAGLFFVAWGLFFPIFYLQVSRWIVHLSMLRSIADYRSLHKITVSVRISSFTLWLFSTLPRSLDVSRLTSLPIKSVPST